MRLQAPYRFVMSAAALAVWLACTPAFARGPQPGAAARRNVPSPRATARPPIRATEQEHLQQWMERHQNVPMQEQLRQLQNEPGFKDLPSETQQRYRDRLIQLNNMNPEQRDRILQRNEALERMTLPERQQYRSAVQQFAAAPPDRRRLMARAVLDLRAMPPDQRQGVINSDRFRAEFNDSERSTLTSLLSVEPYTGPQAAR